MFKTFLGTFLLAMLLTFLTSFIFSPYPMEWCIDGCSSRMSKHGWPFPYPNSSDSYVVYKGGINIKQEIAYTYGSMDDSFLVPSWVRNTITGTNKFILILILLLNIASWYAFIFACSRFYRKYIENFGPRLVLLSGGYVLLLFISYMVSSISSRRGLVYVSAMATFVAMMLLFVASVSVCAAMVTSRTSSANLLIAALILTIPLIFFLLVAIYSSAISDLGLVGLVILVYVMVVHLAPLLVYFMRGQGVDKQIGLFSN